MRERVIFRYSACLRQQVVAELERALGRTQAQSVLNQAYLELACEELGQAVESFTKKCAGRLCTEPLKAGS